MAISAKTAPPSVVLGCARAAHATALCAADCLGTGPPFDGGRCGESCLLATRTLGACADLLSFTPHEDHAVLTIAMARAGVIAAESCFVECSLHCVELDSCARAVDACRLAAAELRQLIEELAPLANAAAPGARGNRPY